MMSKEYCRYIRTYSELEGLQHARTLVYCGASVPQGAVLELRQEQSGRVQHSAVLLPQTGFPRAMQLLRYLCENGVGPDQWLEVLQDAGQSYRLPDTLYQNEERNLDFCALCPV